MTFVFILLGAMLLLDVLCWRVAAKLAARNTWRRIAATFICAQVAGLLWIIFGRMFPSGGHHSLSKFAAAAIYIWHFLGLPLVVALGIFAAVPAAVRSLLRRDRAAGETATAHEMTRRDFLGFAAAAAPPLFTFSLATVAMDQLNDFRTRRCTVPIPNLPRDLEGATIAQVSDMHVGRFTCGRVLRRVVDEVNAMRADLVLLTGDLINTDLADLDEGLALVRQMDARFGVYLIEGNHDLIENGAEFERRVKASGIPFLLDESTIATVRGYPLQLLGLSWTRARQNRDAAIRAAVETLLQQRRPEILSILLAHHPHAFDAAADAGIPLTLSGHTHGGQLMLNEQSGFGPAMFRYWSGEYERNGSKLIVSNGVGNWFPLRVNAPAEIVHITLRRA